MDGFSLTRRTAPGRYIFIVFCVIFSLSAEVSAYWTLPGFPRITSCDPDHPLIDTFDGGLAKMQWCVDEGAICRLSNREPTDCTNDISGHNVRWMWAGSSPPCGQGQRWATNSRNGAGSCVPDTQGDPKCRGLGSGPDRSAGSNPVDLTSGNKFQRELDYRFHQSEHALRLERMYNSNRRLDIGGFGRGWSSVFDARSYRGHRRDSGRISLPEDTSLWELFCSAPRFAGAGGVALENPYDVERDQRVFALPDGRVLTYQRDNDESPWELADGDGIALSVDADSGAATLSHSDGRRSHFDPSGALLYVESRNGLRTRLQDDGQGQLLATDAHGNRLRLDYRTEVLLGYPPGSSPCTPLQEVELGELRLFTRARLENIGAFSYDYDADYRLTRVSFDGLDGTHTERRYSYYDDPDRLHRLRAIHDLLDGQWQQVSGWDYDSNGRAILSYRGSDAEPKESVQFDYRFDAANKTVKVSNALGKETLYAVEDFGYKKEIAQVSGQASEHCAAASQYHGYDDNAYLQTATDWEGNVTETLRNDRGLVIRERSALVWSGWPISGELTETADTRQIDTRWDEYWNLPLEKTFSGKDQNGEWHDFRQEHYSYNTRGELLTLVIRDLSDHQQPYSTFGRERRYRFDRQYTNPASSLMTRLTVNGPLLPAETVNGIDDITVYDYDEQGQLQKVTNALGHETLYSDYHPSGKVGRITDANATVTEFKYNALGDLVEIRVITDDGIARTRLAWYGNRRLKQLQLATGAEFTFNYDEAGYLTEISDDTGASLSYRNNALKGDWESVTLSDAQDRLLVSQSRVLDELGRVLTVSGNQGQLREFGYDANGRAVTDTQSDAQQYFNRHVTQKHYDHQGRLVDIVDPLLNRIELGYDEQGNLASLTDPRSNTTRYLYDGFGQLIQRDSPDTGRTVYHYDSAGNLSSTVNERGIITSTAYDALSRPVEQFSNLGEQVVSFSYDGQRYPDQHGIGRLTAVSDASAYSEYLYNDVGQLKEERKQFSVTHSPVLLTTRYRYDLAGELSAVTYPGGRELQLLRNKGRLSQLKTRRSRGTAFRTLLDIQHQSFVGPTMKRFGNTLTEQRAYDLDGRLSELSLVKPTLPMPQPVIARLYHYDAFDNIERIDSSISTALNQNFQYDKLDRLQQESLLGSLFAYSYDANGNRLQRTQQGLQSVRNEAYQVSENSNRINSISIQEGGNESIFSLHYDEAGNTTEHAPGGGDVLRLDYDENGRLRSIGPQ